MSKKTVWVALSVGLVLLAAVIVLAVVLGVQASKRSAANNKASGAGLATAFSGKLAGASLGATGSPNQIPGPLSGFTAPGLPAAALGSNPFAALGGPPAPPAGTQAAAAPSGPRIGIPSVLAEVQAQRAALQAGAEQAVHIASMMGWSTGAGWGVNTGTGGLTAQEYIAQVGPGFAAPNPEIEAALVQAAAALGYDGTGTPQAFLGAYYQYGPGASPDAAAAAAAAHDSRGTYQALTPPQQVRAQQLAASANMSLALAAARIASQEGLTGSAASTPAADQQMVSERRKHDGMSHADMAAMARALVSPSAADPVLGSHGLTSYGQGHGGSVVQASALAPFVGPVTGQRALELVQDGSAVGNAAGHTIIVSLKGCPACARLGEMLQTMTASGAVLPGQQVGILDKEEWSKVADKFPAAAVPQLFKVGGGKIVKRDAAGGMPPDALAKYINTPV